MKRFIIISALIFLSFLLLPYLIYSLQQNIIVNGNFTGGSSTAWTYNENDISSVATSNFVSTGGNNDAGVWYLQVLDDSTSLTYIAEANLTNDGNSWTNPGILTSATALFSYKQTWAISAPTTNTIKTYLVKPDSSELLLFTKSSTINDTVYNLENIDIAVGNFTQNGVYKLKLFNSISTPTAKSTVKNYWDDIDLILIYEENPPIITVQFPLNISYTTDAIWANLTLDKVGDWCGYSLDNAANVSMTNSTGNWNSLVESLSDATHNITFSCNDTSGNMNTSGITIYFTVDTTPPTIYVQSPENTTYTSKNIDLNVSSDETIDVWQYSLNGASNVTFDPNTTITAIAGQNNIVIYANDTTGNYNSTTIYFTLNTSLEVTLIEPSTSFTTNIIQNTTFLVNATVVCRQGNCGDVSATIRYNKTTANPDTSVNITSGAEPLFIDEASPTATKSCSTNPLVEDEYCNITWTINATDTTFNFWKLDINFSSDSGWTIINDTLDSTIEIVPCVVDITVGWESIDFSGSLTPNTYENQATGNDANQYNITINEGSCNTDLYMKGTDIVDSVNGYVLGGGNLTWSNTSNTYSESYNMTTTYSPVKINALPQSNITTWFWINIPPIFAANYNGTVYLQGVETGDPAP